MVYHGLYSEAIDYATAIIHPLEEGDNVGFQPEQKLLLWLYFNTLQKVYQRFKTTQKFDATEIAQFTETYDLDENTPIMARKHKALQASIDLSTAKYLMEHMKRLSCPQEAQGPEKSLYHRFFSAGGHSVRIRINSILTDAFRTLTSKNAP